MHFRALSCLLVLATLSLAAPPAHSDDIYTFIVKKQEDKQSTRWSLEDWLETRDKMRLMDLWLALHSPSPYEFFVGGGYLSGQSSSAGRSSGWNLDAGAYASIFGLEGARESISDQVRYTGLFNLRLFGFHAQGTNLTAQAGIRSLSAASSPAIRSALAGGSLTIYLAKFFGVQGLYRHFFASTPDAAGAVWSGNRYEGGAFIDFNFVRVTGTYFSEPLSNASGSGTLSGASLGALIYF